MTDEWEALKQFQLLEVRHSRVYLSPKAEKTTNEYTELV
jgi:hypothetical protein